MPVDHIEETLPSEVVTREALGIAQPSEPELEVALWSLLLEDPLFELRLIGEGGPAGEEGGIVVVGDLRADRAAVVMLQGLQARSGSLDLTGMGITLDEILKGADVIADAPELLAAAQAARKASAPDFIAALVRAVVAQVLASHRFGPPGTAPAVLFDRDQRNQLLHQLDQALAPSETRGLLTDWIKKKVGGFVVQRASSSKGKAGNRSPPAPLAGEREPDRGGGRGKLDGASHGVSLGPVGEASATEPRFLVSLEGV